MSLDLRYLVPLSALLLTTCSWTTNFIVMNRTTEPVRVSYLARPLRTVPAVIANSNSSEGLDAWTPLNVLAARRDSASLTVALGPDSSLLLAQVSTYTGYDDWQADDFEIKSLSISRTLGERLYRGREVLHAFDRRSDRLYVIEVR